MLSNRFPWSRGNRHCLLHRYIIEVPDYLSTDTWLLSLLCRFLAALQSHIGVCNLTHHHSYIRVYCVADIVTRPLFAIRIKANWEIFCLVISDKVSLENFPPVFMQTGLKGGWSIAQDTLCITVVLKLPSCPRYEWGYTVWCCYGSDRKLLCSLIFP